MNKWMRLVRPDETIEDLQLRGLRLIKSSAGFQYGTDQVLLADFARVKNHAHVCDLGAGSGILTLLLIGRSEGLRVEALEIDPVQADRMRRCMLLNGLEEAVSVRHGDIRQVRQLWPPGCFQLVVCNPPYHDKRAAQDMPDTEKQARTEWGCTYMEVCSAAKWLLCNKGRFVAMCPAGRMAEMIAALSANRLQVKRLRMVQPSAAKPPYLCLIEAMAGAKPGLQAETALLLQAEDGNMSREVMAMYRHTEEKP